MSDVIPPPYLPSMTEPTLILLLVVVAALLTAVLFLLLRLAGRLDHRVADGVRRAVADDLRAGREEASRAAMATRGEITRNLEMVNERLEAVHRGLGEMQSLAGGVDDLRRVLSNVKVRGTWAEVQLGAILEEFLAPGQYETNVATRADSSERVEFAVRLPGRGVDQPVWLPIDSKFPRADYLRLQEAAEAGDSEGAARAVEALARTLRDEAKKIRSKYVEPPNTTDFAVLYLATEGLYAEVTRQPELVGELQDRYRIMVAGPTTLAALLSSLQMGFRTLAIEQRAAEVWETLAAVKTEFGKFGRVLERLKRQLDTASNTVSKAEVRTRAMARRLEAVEELPAPESAVALELPLSESSSPDEGD